MSVPFWKTSRVRCAADWVFQKAKCETAQSTVEYAIVMAALLAVMVAIGLLMGALRDGLFVEHAVAAASHNIEVMFGGMADVFSY